MSTIIIEPSRREGEPSLSGPVLFWVNPGDTQHILREAKDRGALRHFLFHSNLLEIPGPNTSYWAGPALGAPAAVLALEKLIALGAQNIVVYGWCGSLTSSLGAEQIFIPTWSKSEEGTSAHYPGENPSRSTPELRQKLAYFFSGKGYPVQQGPIWTTDAPYRETKDKVDNFAGQGIMAVDMEFSALCKVASFRGINFAAVMLVSDELWHDKWFPVFHRKSFKKLSRQVFLDFAGWLENNFSA
ncbi:MAG: nucleoside phosphorylase [Pseudomonadota bacterium]